MNYQKFVTEYLAGLAVPGQEDRAALADLRRGIGDFPQIPKRSFKYVIPCIPENADAWQRQTYFLTASLFALHPLRGDHTKYDNMGTHFGQLLDPNNSDKNKPIERRFGYLLIAHPQDLHLRLRQAVMFLKSKAIPINWEQLMWDIHNWHSPEHLDKLTNKWASEFWGATAKNKSTEEAHN